MGARVAVSRPVPFAKVHGLGNCYLYVDTREGSWGETDWPEQARRMSDRNVGIGSDGLILVTDSTRAPVGMRVFNADGSEAEMCGNGLRGFVKYLYDRGEWEAGWTVETGAGVLVPEVVGTTPDGRAREIRVDMGCPHLFRPALPLSETPEDRTLAVPVTVGGRELRLTLVSMGNPHAVHFADRLWDREETRAVGRLVETHPWFPERTNFHVVEVKDRGRVAVRHWERGAGLTEACGTGAAAVAVAAVLNGFTDRRVLVQVPGGVLDLSWTSDDHVMMTGPAEEVCTGLFNIR